MVSMVISIAICGLIVADYYAGMKCFCSFKFNYSACFDDFFFCCWGDVRYVWLILMCWYELRSSGYYSWYKCLFRVLIWWWPEFTRILCMPRVVVCSCLLLCKGWLVDSIGKKCGRLIVPNFSACLGLYVEVLETMDLMCASIFVPDVYDFVRWKSYLLGTNGKPILWL